MDFTISRTDLYTTKQILIHGIGMTLLPGSNVQVNIILRKNIDLLLKDIIGEASQQVLVPVSKCARIIPVEFSEPLRVPVVPVRGLPSSASIKIDVSVTGNGSARSIPSDQIVNSMTGTLIDKMSVLGQKIERSEKSEKIIKICKFP